MWWNGPTWLLREPSGWPSNVETHRKKASFVEEKKSAIVLKTKTNQISGLEAVADTERYSTLKRLLNVTTWLRRAIYNFKRPLTKNECVPTNLTAEELRAAEIEWVITAQRAVREQRNFDQLSRKLGLVVVEGILRCTGRLGNSDLDLDGKQPILLPKQHRFTRLVIEACHEKMHHSGVRSTLAELRSKFWVPKGRQIVKKVLSGSFICKRVIGKSHRGPLTAPLPAFRVTKAHHFQGLE
mgnify:CR=1 FL=1